MQLISFQGMRSRKALLILLTFVFAWFLQVPQVQATESLHPAQAVIKQTADQVMVALKENKAELEKDPAGIYGLVSEIVLPNFDFARISKLVLGRYARKASEAELASFQQEFSTLLVRGYALSLLDFVGSAIKMLPLRASSDENKIIVRTEVAPPGGSAIEVQYRLYRQNDVWKVVDVRIDGISLVTNYRTSFGSIIRRAGVAGLIEKLVVRNAEGAS